MQVRWSARRNYQKKKKRKKERFIRGQRYSERGTERSETVKAHFAPFFFPPFFVLRAPGVTHAEQGVLQSSPCYIEAMPPCALIPQRIKNQQQRQQSRPLLFAFLFFFSPSPLSNLCSNWKSNLVVQCEPYQQQQQNWHTTCEKRR